MHTDLTPLNSSDLETLDALRVERFRAFFETELRCSTLHISECDRTLIISGGQEVATLRSKSWDLSREAWFILGVSKILIYHCSELLYLCDTTIHQTWHKLRGKGHGEIMVTAAVQDKDLVTQEGNENGATLENGSTRTPVATIIKSLALADLAADLEATPVAIQEFLEERGSTLIDFGGTIIVLQSEAVVAYEHYSLIRARQKMQERFAAASMPSSSEKPQAPATKESKLKKATLTFKSAFKVNRSNYKRTIQNFLNAMFPDKSEEQSKALTDIAQQSDLGKAYMDKIIKAGEYKDKEHARINLLKAAAQLQQNRVDNQSSEEKVETAAV